MKRIHQLLIGALVVSCASFVWAAARYVPYKNQALGFGVKVPRDWLLKVTPKAAGFTGPGDGDQRPAVGILRSSVIDFTIDQAAAKEFKQKHKPKVWKQTPATLGGSRAIKIVSTNNGQKILEYYVVSPNGGYYLLQCIAPEQEWSEFNDTFATILRTFYFIQ